MTILIEASPIDHTKPQGNQLFCWAGFHMWDRQFWYELPDEGARFNYTFGTEYKICRRCCKTGPSKP